jgi:hypothetical protein
MALTTIVPLSPEQLKNIQSNIWSRGFLKDYKTYYLYLIIDGKFLGLCPDDLAKYSLALILTLE